MARALTIFKNWFLLLPDQSDWWVPSYKSYFNFQQKGISHLFYNILWDILMKKALQEPSRIADITSGPHAETNPFLLNLKDCIQSLCFFCFIVLCILYSLLITTVKPCWDCFLQKHFPVQSTFELLENIQVIIYLFAFSTGKPYHCDPWSVAFLTIGTYIWLPAFNAEGKTKNTWKRLFSCLSQSKQKMDLKEKKSWLEVNRLTLPPEMCGKIKLFLFGANLDKAELLITLVRDTYAI